jgi:hypothetical protein
VEPKGGVGLKAGEMAAIARWQLERWEDIARGWPMRTARRYDKIHHKWRNYIECKQCSQLIFWLQDGHGNQIAWTEKDMLAQVVIHLRNIHREIESEVYNERKDD